jgi:sigma-E factor negative regulatory protein RseB
MMLMAPLFFKRFSALAQSNIAGAAIVSIALSMSGAATTAHAQAPAAVPNEPVLSINDWLLRMHDAAMKKRSYIGTLVQSSPQTISSARIWHACDGAQQMERVETLTGAPRSTFRHNDKLVTFMPDAKLVRVEKREQIGGFPEVLKPGVGSIPEFYAVKALGTERVAGLDADVVKLVPKDTLRFGYRIWTEKKSSLVLKLQTLDAGGVVLEQAAFSELQLDAPVKMEKLMQMMAATEGYKVDQAAITKTTATAEGWLMKLPVAGFKSLSCYKRGANSAQGNAGAPASSPVASPAESTFQWLFSDGLATVSLFVEDYDKSRHTQEGVIASGATHTLLKRMNEYWLTAVGEVPPQTLKNFAQSLERKR